MSTATGLVSVGTSAMLGNRIVLQKIDLVAPPGQMVAVVGPNGSGKTTLLRCLAGLLKPLTGSIYMDGKDIFSFQPRERALRIAYLPQEAHVDFPFTALDVVLMGRHPHLHWLDTESSGDLDIALSALENADAGNLVDRPVTELSGGERRRVFFARTLAQEASVLLLDEPTADQDLQHALKLLEQVRNQPDVSIIAVLHDLNLAGRFANKILLMDEGRLIAEGSPAEILRPEVLNPVYRVAISILEDDKHRVVVPESF